ncbi:uncharacterized protein LAESUDRAFT_721875 [Laetiporus sulphureus 93-53]|uniref:Uncharacterized protein n=1 Tax=Laetiporus sulphureus 93-53 TaxID=1314785 RepID=A0A165GL31_9APHY|nr:uncharacterized protein LAESUDRAFT_721875 [Laetiporus sulphureus 93-53]KZT10500.1 hypothetical protein LAESUDRAFT_721875 [Laetiporus sulphureus 93-53]
MSNEAESSLPKLSLHLPSSVSETENWDRTSEIRGNFELSNAGTLGDAGEGGVARTGLPEAGAGKRTLPELLRLHAEKGKDVMFSPTEVRSLAEVLGKWINSGPSPYESEDDFFKRLDSESASAFKRVSPSTHTASD